MYSRTKGWGGYIGPKAFLSKTGFIKNNELSKHEPHFGNNHFGNNQKIIRDKKMRGSVCCVRNSDYGNRVF